MEGGSVDFASWADIDNARLTTIPCQVTGPGRLVKVRDLAIWSPALQCDAQRTLSWMPLVC